MIKKWEGSPADIKADKIGAKKQNESLIVYEHSSIDKKADAKMQRKLNKNSKRAYHAS